MPNENPYDRYLEKRAEELGLPTDPEAYQDGGLAVAAIEGTLAGAEMLAALLKSNNVPAWVKSPLATLMAAEPQQCSVLVPSGRLADAQRIIAEHPHREEPEEAAEEPGAPAEEPEEVAEPATEAPEAAAEPAAPRPVAQTVSSAVILLIGLGGLAYTIAAVAAGEGLAGLSLVRVAVCGILSAAVSAVGILGLMPRREVNS
jgi:hypothetical protein